MKIAIKWSLLTGEQRNQVKSFYANKNNKQVAENLLNRKKFLINTTDGRFVSRKDF